MTHPLPSGPHRGCGLTPFWSLAAVGLLACWALGRPAPAQEAPPVEPATGPFEPTLESLTAYRCPEWFHDAKLGIYVHWGVYSVAEHGEWYAREMYEEGSATYRHHLKTWGHPSEFGYHDLIPLWKAERFDPDAWLALFKEAGAKYFTPCAAHHDGFSLWDDPYQPFNAVRMGPRKDLLGMMRDAALRHGLRFGVTTHFDRSINWLQPAHGADKSGPKAGVPYVTLTPQNQDLYLLPRADGNRADPEDAPTFWREYWLLRQKHLIDAYRPDFIYLDSAVPFAGADNGRAGMRLFAYFYNRNAQWHGGRQEGVMTHKGAKGPKRAPYFDRIATLDIERGRAGSIRDDPWQTDDSIGPWGYHTRVPYVEPGAMVDKLVDIVSKNGNLLLNVPPRADGSLDDQTVAFLKRLGAWVRVNGEAIYATRPWLVFGEGPNVRMGDRDRRSPYTHQNLRFTRSKDGRTLYVVQLAWPGAGERFTVTSLAAGRPGADLGVEGVALLGCDEPIDWARDEQGLHITSPAAAPDELAVAYRVRLAD